MRYLPHTPQDTKEMLATIGASSIAELFTSIPESLRLKRPLTLPKALSEPELLNELNRLADANRMSGVTSYMGAGAYPHFAPSMINHILLRSEFYTAYTPYQPEVAQGTLMAIFEYQTYVSLLLEAEVANASMYDGATAATEAALMARRLGKKRPRVLLAQSVNPEFKRVMRTYFANDLDNVVEVAFDPKSGRIDTADLAAKLGADTACLVIGHPNYFGVAEDVKALAETVQKAGALLVSTFSEPLAFGILPGPGAQGADIVCGEGQSFLGGMNFGGPSLGLFATRDKFLRQMPGRLCGESTDADGRRGYVLTMSTREQHIRREKATSNICTNQGLCALAATIFLSLMGKEGLRRLALQNLENTEYLKTRLKALPGYSLPFSAPTFNEFVLHCERKPAGEIWKALEARDVLAGVELAPDYPTLGSHLLINVTEVHTKAQLDALVDALASA